MYCRLELNYTKAVVSFEDDPLVRKLTLSQGEFMAEVQHSEGNEKSNTSCRKLVCVLEHSRPMKLMFLSSSYLYV